MFSKILDKFLENVLGCKAKSSSTGSTGFLALGFAARFRKNCNAKMLQLLGIPPKLILAVIFCSPYDDQIESGSSEFAFQEDQKLAKDKAQPLVAQGKDDPEVGEEEQCFKDRKKPAPEAAKADEPQVKKPRVATTPPTLKTLLPNKGASHKEVWILRNPKTYGYQIRYPTSVLDINL
jgi:hypothetical protein